ncbi:hypothetical protein MNBD_GAMMA13-1125 [hydrothermal vent metagenome]|uniref:Uncharacterized protein n=1 Tax=hydrothermal vent metagenome TaxID=652676 RepID=A0A3B0Z4K6_9ZZZZ
MQQIRLNLIGMSGMWLLAGLVMACVLVGFLCLASLSKMETRVLGMSTHIGFSDGWSRRFQLGDQLSVAWDRAMPRGYERIYLHSGGDIIGSLPNSPLAIQVREALESRQPVQVTVVELDPLDPTNGFRVRVAFESKRQRRSQPVAVQALNGMQSLM